MSWICFFGKSVLFLSLLRVRHAFPEVTPAASFIKTCAHTKLNLRAVYTTQNTVVVVVVFVFTDQCEVNGVRFDNVVFCTRLS